MRFNSFYATLYRKNGTLGIVLDSKTGYYDLYLNYPNGGSAFLFCHRNKVVTIKEAKRVAMEKQLGFNEQTDIRI